MRVFFSHGYVDVLIRKFIEFTNLGGAFLVFRPSKKESYVDEQTKIVHLVWRIPGVKLYVQNRFRRVAIMKTEIREFAFFAMCLVSFVVYSTAGKFHIQKFLQCNNLMSSANTLKITKYSMFQNMLKIFPSTIQATSIREPWKRVRIFKFIYLQRNSVFNSLIHFSLISSKCYHQ